MLAPWREAFRKEARYPQEWRDDAPYGRLPSGRARNRPPSVLRDPDNPDAGVIDPSEIRYEQRGDKVVACHPGGERLGSYSWEDDDYGGYPHIGIAQVNPKYQGQGVGGGIIDHIREHYQPDLVHSGYRGVGSLSYQGRAGALRDLGNTEEEHNDYFNTTPFNYRSSEPVSFDGSFVKTDAQQRAHDELVRQFEEDKSHPNYTGVTSDNPYDPDMYDGYGDQHEYGYDASGDYVGLSNGGKDSSGYSEEGYDSEGYDRDGFDRGGLDGEGYDQEGFSYNTGLNRDGNTRHGYVPGDGTPPVGTVPMSGMASHWAQHGLPTTPEHQGMMDDADAGHAPTMYAVRRADQRSPYSRDYHVGNGDTVYSSLERARQVAYHPDDPRQDKDIVSASLDPDELHTDASGKTPEDFHYAPVSTPAWGDAEDTASTPADIVHDPQRHQRIQGDLGDGWSQGILPNSNYSSLEYADRNSGRGGRMWQQNNGLWSTEHQPQFGSVRRGRSANYRDAADVIREGTAPGPTMGQHALEVNNDYEASGGGTVDWEPHPNGQGLMAHTPHGDLHVVQDPATGSWNWHAGPHGSQPGDEGNMHGRYGADGLNYIAATSIRSITRRPFHVPGIDVGGRGNSP